MRYVLVLSLLGGLLAIGGSPADAARTPAIEITVSTFGHGGGCRKSSPPGKCCHMEKKTGKVHCH